MSKEYWGFDTEKEQTCFLAGVVDVLSDELSLSCRGFTTLDADIFFIEDGDISKLEESFKKRLLSYMRCYSYYTADDVNSLRLGLKRHDCDIGQYLRDSIDSSYTSSEKARAAADKFLRDISRYLGEPDSIYLLDDNSDVAFNTNRAVSGAYMGIIFGAYFITFKHHDHALMMIFGTSE